MVCTSTAQRVRRKGECDLALATYWGPTHGRRASAGVVSKVGRRRRNVMLEVFSDTYAPVFFYIVFIRRHRVDRPECFALSIALRKTGWFFFRSEDRDAISASTLRVVPSLSLILSLFLAMAMQMEGRSKREVKAPWKKFLLFVFFSYLTLGVRYAATWFVLFCFVFRPGQIPNPKYLFLLCSPAHACRTVLHRTLRPLFPLVSPVRLIISAYCNGEEAAIRKRAVNL